jgi:hypothetical protein
MLDFARKNQAILASPGVQILGGLRVEPSAYYYARIAAPIKGKIQTLTLSSRLSDKIILF